MKKLVFLCAGIVSLSGCITDNPQTVATDRLIQMCGSMHAGMTPAELKKHQECWDQNRPGVYQQVYAEDAQRRAAFQQNMANIQAQQNANYQMQMQNIQRNQMLYQMHRPTQTNCTNLGYGQINCTTY